MEEHSYTGLNLSEVQNLRQKYGYNEIVKIKKTNPLMKFFGVFKEPMFLLLVGAAMLYLILGEPREAFIMMIFVIFVATITFAQEWNTETTVNALRELTSPEVKVLRDSKALTIKSVELVPGDIIFLAEGERIPADCEVLTASNFSVDESLLTGEAEPVFKIPVEGSDGHKKDEENGHWKNYYLYAGTLSIFGKCTAKVMKIGLETEYGKIGKAISETKEKPSPLQRKTGKLVKNLAYAGIVLCSLVVVFSYFYTRDIIQSILSGVTLTMAIIPEEFPVVLTVFLSLGALRLAKRNTLMRRISAVETLGSTTVLCVDKTGTITQNKMKVRYVYDGSFTKEKSSFKSKELSELMILSCEKDPYDPMEKAIVEVGMQNSSVKGIYGKELTYKFAFDPKTKRMANIFKNENGKYYAACKGSPETTLELCTISDMEKQVILKEVDNMASKGLRVMALADAEADAIALNLESYNFRFRGLVGLEDPPKEGVREAVEMCKNAGIRVVMITGDYMKTAAAIGAEIGLKFKHCAITGDEIERMNDEELSEAVKHCDIFSRVVPEHKMRIVKALQKNGEIVAMTGDGVNDATALKTADIGIAMGKRGTEVAKEAAHMILMDDNFTTIVGAVEDGRRVFDNIRKAMVYIMIIHIPIAALSLFAPIFNLPQLLLPVHIVLLELIIDPTCSVVFEGEEAEPYIMEQPPRLAKEPLLTKGMTMKVILQGLSIFLAAFIPFHFMVDAGADIALARSFSLMSLIVSNVVLVLVNRSNTRYLVNIFKEKNNKVRLCINSLALVMVFAVVYINPLHPIFKTASMGLKMLGLSCALGIVSSGWWEVVKIIKNEFKSKDRKRETHTLKEVGKLL
jgi:P-type Ca2+ transporter type 2C